MKKLHTLLLVAFVAIISSCGGSGQGSDEQNADSLATTEQVQTEEEAVSEQTEVQVSEADLYKYFSKEEISEKMKYALKTLDSAYLEEYEDYTDTDIDYYYVSLLKHDGFWSVSPEEAVKKWGKPTKQEKEESEYYDSKERVTYDYSHFTTSFIMEGEEWIMESLSTSTPGFGFAGIYVGIPECNKAYIEKLLAKGGSLLEKFKENGVEKWRIDMGSLSSIELTIIFTPSGTVKQVSYVYLIFEG